MDTIRVTSPQAILLPEFYDLLFSMFQSWSYSQAQAEAAVMELARSATDPLTGIFVDPDLTAVAIVFLPPNPLHRHPQGYGMYNRGTRQAGQAVMTAGVKFCKENGYNDFWMITREKTAWEVFARKWRLVGQAKPIGTILEFDIGVGA